MLKRLFTATRITAAILMVVSVFTPIQIAEASGTITKTITVLGPDGQPYAGAKVALVYMTQQGAIDQSSFSTIGTSDSSGIASINFPESAIFGNIHAEGRSGDTATASYANWNGDFANSNSITINLSRADFAVNILGIDGQPAAALGGLWGEDTDWRYTLRTGAFGVSLRPDATSGGCRMLQPIPADGTQNSFISTYGTAITGSGSQRTVKVYTDFNSCTTEAPKVNGVYQLAFIRGNISGSLRSNTGQSLTFNESQGYEVNSYALNNDGSRNQDVDGAWNFAANNGAWSTYIDTSTPGKYELSFSGYGNTNFPTFSEKYVWVTSDHRLSWNSDGSNSSTSLTQDINIPVPNVKFSFIDSHTSTSAPAYYRVRKTINNAQSPYAYVAAANGSSSFSLTDGTYQINLRDFIKNNVLPFTVTVSGGNVTVVDGNGGNVSATSGVYTIYRAPSNAYFSFKDENGNPVAGIVDFCNNNGCNGHLDIGATGLGDNDIADGVYDFVRIASPGSATLASLKTSATVANGILSIDATEGLTKVGDVWNVTLPNANIFLKVTNPLNNSEITEGNISFETADDNWNPTSFFSNADIFQERPGRANAYLPNGKYLMTVSLAPTDANAGLANKTYQVTVTDGIASISSNGTNVVAVNGLFPLTPSTANLELTVQNLSGSPLTDGWVDACTDLGNGDTGACRGYGFNNTGQVSLSLANGSWIVVVRPGTSITNMASKSYSVTVSNGQATVSGANQVNSRWVLTGATPNVTGSFTLATGSLKFTNNQGISMSVQKFNNGNWEWQNGGSWIRSTNFAVNVTTQGRYRLVANPQNFSDLVQSFSQEFWVNSSGKVSKTELGTYTDSITALTFLVKSPNLKLKVLNPIDSSLLPGGWVTIEKIDNPQSRHWVGNADIQNSNPGITGFNLSETGDYLLTVNPPNGNGAVVGLATKQYQLTVAANDSMTVALDGAPVSVDSGRFVLSPAKANITGRILKADGTVFGSSSGKWINANLQHLNANNGNWEWSNIWSNADQDGYISMRVSEAGTYRLRVEPSGDADSTVTYSSEFSVTSDQLNTFSKDFGSICLAGPSIKVSVATSGNPSTPLNYAGVEIRKDGNWLDWANTQRSGVAGISLKSEGTYEFIVNPPQDLQGSTSRRSYQITAVKNGDGNIVATAAAGTGVSVANGVTTLLLGTPTLSGTVLAPSPSSAPQANSQVYAHEVSTGRDLWENSSSTNQNGVWAMSLPAGTYKIYAKTPWGTSSFGGSDGVGNVVVDSSGTATTVPVGLSYDSFTIRLKDPTWSGTVKSPSGAGVSNARVCLRLNNEFTCVNADNSGAWALSAPEGFTNFTGTNPYLEINDDFTRQYPQRHWEGITAVNTAIGTGGSGINLQFADANTQITITAGGNPVTNVWVMAERDGTGWLGGASTNANGVAKLNITDPSAEFRVRVDLQGNPIVASSYATTMKTYTTVDISSGTSAGVFSGTLALAEPNFKVVLREPTSDRSVGNVIPYSWIELFDDSTGTWLGGATTDANGFASFKLDVPQSGSNKFVVNVNPQWNASTNFSRQAYSVNVTSFSSVTVTNKITTVAVTSQSVSGRNVFPLTLGNPSVTGVVVDPNGNNVANSWVVPIDAVTSEYLWQQGAGSRNNGAIGLNLANGSYKLEANVPWGTSDVAKSAQCAVTVTNGTISTGGSCVQNGSPKTVRLALRAPNLAFTLKIGGVGVANANVGIGYGRWFTNAQSDAEGHVSLFVDADAIRTLNSVSTSVALNVWVDPPYGGSVEMARWDCSSGQSKPVCSLLPNVPATGDYPTTALGDVTGMAPNTRIHIVAPGTSTSLPNSWVTVQAFDPAHPEYGTRWLGGGNSNTSGYVSMNLETSTVPSGWKFAVEINAPWNQRQTYATNFDNNAGSGYSWAEVTNLPNKSPKNPNLTLTISGSNASANKFGWIGVEEVNNSLAPIKWIGGYGLNENGITSVYLPASKKYRITAFPGQGTTGARTTCLVQTNSFETVTMISNNCDAGSVSNGAGIIALDGGNVVGLVSASGTPLAGAIVYANISGSIDESTAVITSTGTDGRYGLQLDSNQSWDIKVFPTGVGSDLLSTGQALSVSPPSSGSRTQNFAIVTR